MHTTTHADLPDPGCTAFLAALDAVLDGGADVFTAARVESHAGHCGLCAEHLAAARRYRARMQALGARTVAPESLRARVTRLQQAVRGSRTH
jgi:predicted anti-sigma-YlaC factor YlaD